MPAPNAARHTPHKSVRAHLALKVLVLVQCGSCKGADRLYLRIPLEVVHQITDDSPIASWRSPEALLRDKDCELVVVVRCTAGLYQPRL